MPNKTHLIVSFLMLFGDINAAETYFHVQIAGPTTFLIGDDKKDFNLMTPAEQEESLRNLRLELDKPVSDARNTAMYILLLLNDEAGIKHIVKDYHTGSYVAKTSIQDAPVSVLPFLVDDIYNGSTATRGGGDTPLFSIRDDSTLMIWSIIHSSILLPDATRVWAAAASNQFLHGASWSLHEQARTQLKDWWEHNKDNIMAKHYDQATWLPTEILDLNPPPNPASTAPAQALVSYSPTKSTPLPLATSTTPFNWLAAAAILVLTVVFGIRTLRRKPPYT